MVSWTGRGAVRRRGVGDLDLDVLGAADDAEAGRAQHLQPAVELAGLAGQKRLHRRIEAEPCGGGGDVVHLAVGDHDHPGEPVRRHVGQGLGEIAEQHGAVALAVGRGRGRMHPAHIEIGESLESLLQFLADLVGPRGAAGDRLALAVVEHHGDDVAERLAVLLLELGIGDGEQQQRVAQQPENRAAARAPEQKRRAARRPTRRAPTARARARRVGTRWTSSWRHCPRRSSRAGTCTWSAL